MIQYSTNSYPRRFPDWIAAEKIRYWSRSQGPKSEGKIRGIPTKMAISNGIWSKLRFRTLHGAAFEELFKIRSVVTTGIVKNSQTIGNIRTGNSFKNRMLKKGLFAFTHYAPTFLVRKQMLGMMEPTFLKKYNFQKWIKLSEICEYFEWFILYTLNFILLIFLLQLRPGYEIGPNRTQFRFWWPFFDFVRNSAKFPFRFRTLVVMYIIQMRTLSPW